MFKLNKGSFVENDSFFPVLRRDVNRRGSSQKKRRLLLLPLFRPVASGPVPPHPTPPSLEPAHTFLVSVVRPLTRLPDGTGELRRRELNGLGAKG